MSEWRRLILPGCLVGVLGLVAVIVAICAGLIRPPRPMFHDSDAAGGFGLVPYWIANTPLADARGQWLWLDAGDNVIDIHATGTAERGRSQSMAAGRTRASNPSSAASRDRAPRSTRACCSPAGSSGIVIAMKMAAAASVLAAMSAAVPGRFVRARDSTNAAANAITPAVHKAATVHPAAALRAGIALVFDMIVMTFASMAICAEKTKADDAGRDARREAATARLGRLNR